MESLERHTSLKLPLIDAKCLEWWKMSKEEFYVPKTNWNEIVEQNGIVIGDKVQVWSFRANKDGTEDQLHLALVLVKRGESQIGDGKKSGQENDSNSEGSTVSNL
ncbi:B3 domain-containing protein [Rosa sericea]